MINRIRAARENAADQGFTLVEMLIVIIVLGVLAGIAVFGVASFRDDAEASACDASVKTVQTAVDAYKAKNDAVPTAAQLENGDYIKDVPSTIVISNAGVVSSNPACA